MESREEKNKDLVKEIRHERNIEISKIILKIFFIILVTMVILFLYMHYLGTKFIQINEYRVYTNNNDFYGLKILQFSDLLYGSSIDQNSLEELENKINRINPDLVLFTGNLISKDYQINDEEQQILIKFLTNIKADYGKYAVYGNHDNLTYNEIINQSGFNLLDNQSIDIYNKTNNYIKLIGLNSNNVEPIQYNDNNYQIAIINNYDYYEKFNTKANLVLAGNNLGGEIKLPLIGGIIKNNNYMDDYYQLNNSEIYISNGLGSNHHLRFFNHPSINVFRLY